MLVSNWPFVAGCRLYLHLDHFENILQKGGWSCVQESYCVLDGLRPFSVYAFSFPHVHIKVIAFLGSPQFKHFDSLPTVEIFNVVLIQFNDCFSLRFIINESGPVNYYFFLIGNSGKGF